MTDEKRPIHFTVNYASARLLKYLPKHHRAEDAPLTAELQFRDVRITASAAAAALVCEGDGGDVLRAFFFGEGNQSMFPGAGNFNAVLPFKEKKHTLRVDHIGPRKVEQIDKIRVRFEGGPQQLIWADFSVHIEDLDEDEAMHYHEMQNRDVELVIDQGLDAIDEMRAHLKGMAVSTTLPNLELDLEQRDAAQLQQAADGLKDAA